MYIKYKMKPMFNIIKRTNSWVFFSLPLLSILLVLLYHTHAVQLHSNFNTSKIAEITIGDPISLPIILSLLPQRKHTTQQFAIQMPSSLVQQQDKQKQNMVMRLKRYQLKDTRYHPQDHDLNSIEQQILFNMEPPISVFDVSRAITVEDYMLLEVKDLRIVLTNPTDRFRFCVNEIYTDSQAVRRLEQRKLPFCLNPNNKYPFFFILYLTEHKPHIFRTTLYFIISIYDGNQLVDQKIWPRQIIVKVSNNHLRLHPVQAKNCVGKNFTILTLQNPQPNHIKIAFQNDQDLPQKLNIKQIMIPSQKNFKLSILSKQATLVILTRPHEQSLSDARYPKLYLPIYCVRPLQFDHFQIGIFNSERSLMEILVPVSSNSKETIQIKSIEVVSSTGTVEVQPISEFDDRIQAGSQHVGICRLLAHVPRQMEDRTEINVKVTYYLATNAKQIFQVKNTYKFAQFRNPLSLGSRRFIDVTKPDQADPIVSNIFPIRNNLNLPLLLVRVMFDQKLFKLTWLKDRREYIFPNQQRDQFSLQYIGSKSLSISPTKHLLLLQFNGNVLIPVQVILYDHSLQCVYNNIQQKCQNMGIVDYGYFRNSVTKFKQIVIRNWNPVAKELRIKILQNLTVNYGMNVSMNIFGPFPNYQTLSRHANNTLFYYLKGNHFIIINIAMTPLKNATSGQTSFEIFTQNQQIMKKIKFKVENGTIALLPHTLRIGSAYEHTVQYLNLVSTFSQPYKIKSTFVNNGNINVFFNNHSEIYENQWIGLALVYDPFSNNSPNMAAPGNPSSGIGSGMTTSSSASSPAAHMSTSTSSLNPAHQATLFPSYNITQQCCGYEFGVNNFINVLLNEYKRFTNISVRVVTTTQLQANSTIIIDNTPPKMIRQQNFTISLINYNKNCASSQLSDKVLQNCKGSKSCPKKQNKDYIIKLTNVFKYHLKYKPIIVPRSLVQDTKQYVSTMKRVRRIYEQDTMLCVNNAIAVKHNFSPQMVKTILGLDSVPQQITIQPLQNQQYYIGSQRKSSLDSSTTSQLSQYVRRTVDDGARVCYKMNTTKYIKQLIQSHILNDIAQNYSSEIFQQFVEKEMQINHHSLHYDQFYDSLVFNFQKYCRKFVYPLFRFCQQIGVQIMPNTQHTLEPGATNQIIIRPISKFKQSSQSFYIVLLNNVTKYEVHLISINITQPKLKIMKVIEQVDVKAQVKVNNRIQEKITKISKAFSIQNYIKLYMTRKDLSKLAKIKQNQVIENDQQVKKYLSNMVPIILASSDIKEQSYGASRSFTIKNTGTVDINITHVGFEGYPKLCEYEGIKISDQFCNGIIIQSGKQANLNLSVSMAANSFYDHKIINLYLYSDDAFYFRFNVVVKGIYNNEYVSWEKSAYSFAMNAISFIYLLLVILMFKKEIDQKQNAKKMNSKTKIMNPSNYGMLGTRLQRKVRRLEPIPEDQIAAVKQIQQSKLKQFFNSSGESEIAKRQHTQEEQTSKIQILNALKDRNNMSASEQSSIDFIDLNALNKSTQNMEQDGQDGNQEMVRDPDQQIEDDQFSEDSGKFGSDADSNFNEGDEVDYSAVAQDYGWGDQRNQRKKQQQNSSYYNVFFSQNPLKKNEKPQPFHWMKESQRAHHR